MEELADRLRSIYGGRRWIVAAEAAAGATAMVAKLREWNAEALVVAATPGVGDLPEAPTVYTDTRGATLMGGFRAYISALADPSPDVRKAVHGFDPDEDALVLKLPHDAGGVALGRPAYGARPLEWLALEDKMIADELWAAAGIATAPSAVVPVSGAPAAAVELASGMGTVWVADNTEGWHGGGEYVRWVADAVDHKAAVDWFASRAHRVRVMPFLEGLPCSIHGWVGPEGVAVFKPVEIVILRRSEPPGFIYAGVSTRWDAPASTTEHMRDAAGLVGAELRRRVDYRGPFGIDGVATGKGFLPTELNPRFSTGFGVQALGLPFPQALLFHAFLAGDIDLDLDWFEGVVLAAREATRKVGMGLPVSQALPEARVGVVYDGAGKAAAVDPDDGNAQGIMSVGPGINGSYVVLSLHPGKVEMGGPMAPLAAEAVRLAVELWGVDLPPLAPAQDITG